MARVVEVHVSGLAELERKLEHLPLKVARAVLRRGLRAVKIWRDEMAARVRRGPHHPRGGGSEQEGVLAKTEIVSTTVKSDLEGRARAGPSRKSFWALFVEFGTAARTRRKPGETRALTRARNAKLAGGNRMPAFPFIRPAFEAKKQEVLDTFVSETKAAFDEEGMPLS